MKHIQTPILGFFVAMSLFAPLSFVGAQGLATGDSDPKSQAFQIVPCTGVVASSTNPGTQKECDFAQLLVMVNRIISFLLYLSIPLVLGMIMFTAFKYITANGDPKKLADAKRMFVPVVIGLFWILGSYIIVYTVLDNLLADYIGGTNATNGDPKANVIFLNMFK